MSGPAPPTDAGWLPRYGLNQAWNSRFRACASSTMNFSTSKPGSCPRTPVSHSDHGPYSEGQSASPLGRTCTKIALWLSRCARSSQPRYSDLIVSASRPRRLGQSMLLTVVSHMPRSSRVAVSGCPAHVGAGALRARSALSSPVRPGSASAEVVPGAAPSVRNAMAADAASTSASKLASPNHRTFGRTERPAGGSGIGPVCPTAPDVPTARAGPLLTRSVGILAA
jgi:hypothetical protein